MIVTILRGKKYRFETKAGLFSKDEVDSGSRLLIETMLVNSNDAVLDIGCGCGYGVIGLVAATLACKGETYMVDTDIRAIKYSKINAELNNIKNVEIIASDGFEGLPVLEFDTIVSNPPSHLSKETMIGFIEGAKERLNRKGKLYFVNERRLKPLVKREFERVFGNYKAVAHNLTHVVSIAYKYR